ncbi:hypothetical protein ISR94_03350 [Candidatus Microgenomates bacterium]|nr:hypothetical protein [Candidatus Microgenomates bacterium]
MFERIYNLEKYVVMEMGEDYTKEMYREAAEATPGVEVSFFKRKASVQPKIRLRNRTEPMVRIYESSGKRNLDDFWQKLGVVAEQKV